MKIVLVYNQSTNSFVLETPAEDVRVKSRCTDPNLSYPNLILLEVPGDLEREEKIRFLEESITLKTIGAETDLEALANLSAQFKEVCDERDALRAKLAEYTEDKVAEPNPGEGETQPEEIITTQFEAKEEKEATDQQQAPEGKG